MGDLVLTFHHEGSVEKYQHKLDLKQALVTTGYEIDKVKYQREIFSSYPEQVIVIRLTADKPHKITFDATLKRSENASLSLDHSSLIMTGNLYTGGIDYGSLVTILPSGGSWKTVPIIFP